MVDVSFYGHFERPTQCFEDGLYFMMLVGSFGFDIEIHLSGIAQAFKEMVEHFGGHVAYFFAVEGGVPHEPWPTAEVEGELAQTVVHR